MPMLNPLQRDALLYARVLGGSVAFDERAFISTSNGPTYGDWGSYPARLLRYITNRAHYEGNVYRDIHPTAAQYKARFGLYDFSRTIFSPVYRLTEFYATHLMGGTLDPAAGDGTQVSSALPIRAEGPKVDALRAVIAHLWRTSNWQFKKEIYCRNGAALGDTFLGIDDDIYRRNVYLRVIDPMTIADIDEDVYGNVKGYEIRQWRADPRQSVGIARPKALYIEVAEKVGESVSYQTFIDDYDTPYDWHSYPDARARRIGPDWIEDYGFVPLVKVQHRDMGFGWGMAEMHPSLSRFHELDDLTSKLDDQIRKEVENPRLLAGVTPPGATLPDGTADPQALVVGYPDDTAADAEPERSHAVVFFCNNSAANSVRLLGNLDIAATSAHILTILKEVERNHPELQADMATASGDASGRALRVARERSEALLIQRRAGYDDGLVRAHAMAISIGALKGYSGYEEFDAGSYKRGELDHYIGDRPVFAVDQADTLELAQAFATAFKTMTDAGMPARIALQRLNASEEEIAEFEQARADEETRTERRLAAKQRQMFATRAVEPDLPTVEIGGDGRFNGNAP
jgi:hypothetical protein